MILIFVANITSDQCGLFGTWSVTTISNNIYFVSAQAIIKNENGSNAKHPKPSAYNTASLPHNETNQMGQILA